MRDGVLKIGLIGGGNMGRALLGAWLRSGMRAEDIVVTDSHAPTREALAREFGIAVTADNAAAVAADSVLIAAVKPQDMAATLGSLHRAIQRAKPIVLSVAAGIRIADLLAWCGPGIDVVRCMPNRAALVGAGATGCFAEPAVAASSRALAERVLRPSGAVVWVGREELLDAVTALSGSGPAYFFALAEAMVDAGRALGLPAETAQALAVATLQGSGLLAAQSGGELARLRTEITSRGGTTEAALRVMQEQGFGAIIARAMAAAAARSRELADSFGTQSPRHTEP
jgi:pyrroline-5-carboxylate reductase